MLLALENDFGKDNASCNFTDQTLFIYADYANEFNLKIILLDVLDFYIFE